MHRSDEDRYIDIHLPHVVDVMLRSWRGTRKTFTETCMNTYHICIYIYMYTYVYVYVRLDTHIVST